MGDLPRVFPFESLYIEFVKPDENTVHSFEAVLADHVFLIDEERSQWLEEVAGGMLVYILVFKRVRHVGSHKHVFVRALRERLVDKVVLH